MSAIKRSPASRADCAESTLRVRAGDVAMTDGNERPGALPLLLLALGVSGILPLPPAALPSDTVLLVNDRLSPCAQKCAS
jgi:hypothetical protein